MHCPTTRLMEIITRIISETRCKVLLISKMMKTWNLQHASHKRTLFVKIVASLVTPNQSVQMLPGFHEPSGLWIKLLVQYMQQIIVRMMIMIQKMNQQNLNPTGRIWVGALSSNQASLTYPRLCTSKVWMEIVNWRSHCSMWIYSTQALVFELHLWIPTWLQISECQTSQFRWIQILPLKYLDLKVSSQDL